MTATTTAQGRIRARGQASNAKPRARSRGAPPSSALIERATQNTLAANPLIGIRRKEVLGAASTLLARLARQPGMVTREYTSFLGELGRVAAGRSALVPATGDRRFNDAAWNDSAGFRRLLQAYVALGKSLDRTVDEAKLDPLATERARFVTSLLIDAIAPTNFIVTNPAALRKARATKGASVIRGLANLVEDVTSGRWLPRQVDARPFMMGKNIANTRGAVVYRNDVLEVIQYAPTTSEVHKRPLVIVPPQINKYYAFDLAPGKSIVQWSLEGGVRTFAVSWRNPTAKDADWGFDAYVGALEQAVDAIREITGAPDVNVWGACSGGITLTAFLGFLAARGRRKVHSATLAVCVLDTSAIRDTTAGLFVTPATIKAARAASRKRGVVEGNDLARMFAWMRPNDLVWNYVVNNYLLGNDPPAHDILYWNNDATRLPARLHSDFLDLIERNPFAHPRTLTIRGRKIDVSRIGIDTFVVGGLADHITPWQGVYRTARLYGGSRSTFVLSNGGHIQSLINPPGNARSWFIAGPARASTPDAWLAKRNKVEGSWWPHWRAWIRQRSGSLQPATETLGSTRHAPLAAAPGTYVFER
ncbi:MAG TPA: alpha/beta fold hydrolase [Casimicrobiaceae bacterium]|nr:alpha/beta fold hydrolase [Casimicrobiaceae bacterium]